MMRLVEDYLAVRRATGFDLRTTERRLRSFARFAAEREDGHIRVATAIDWAATARSPWQRYVRLRDVVLLARHLSAEDPAHEIPNGQVFPRTRQEPLPYVFSDEEVLRMLDAASRLGPPGSSRPDTYRTLLGLLVATGMRIGEALRLRIGDLTVDGLRIHATKFRKSRLLPIHATTKAALEDYRIRWRPVASAEEPFLVSTRGTALATGVASGVFAEIMRDLGMKRAATLTQGRRPRPCLQDMRPTFATRTLEACPAGRTQINRHLLALTTYLGHVSVASTYWYLHATPRLMSDVADVCEAWHLGPIP